MSINILKRVYWLSLTIMKKVLSLYEYKVGKNSEEYRYFKKEVMDYFYIELNKFYQDLLKQGLVEKCSCDAKIRKGYSNCESCGGSGYKDKDK